MLKRRQPQKKTPCLLAYARKYKKLRRPGIRLKRKSSALFTRGGYRRPPPESRRGFSVIRRSITRPGMALGMSGYASSPPTPAPALPPRARGIPAPPTGADERRTKSPTAERRLRAYSGPPVGKSPRRHTPAQHEKPRPPFRSLSFIEWSREGHAG